MITSTTNAQIKNIKKLMSSSTFRKSTQQFVVEGLRVVKDTPRENIIKIYFSESFAKNNDIRENFNVRIPGIKSNSIDCNYEIIRDDIFNSISDTTNSQGILAICKMNINDDLSIIDDECDLIVICDRIQDPGNMGTIIRTSLAASVDALILSDSCVDIYNPKVVRSSASAIFKLPILKGDLVDIIKELQDQDFNIISTSLDTDTNIYTQDFTCKSAIVIGNEANGIREEILDMSNSLVNIPISDSIESLNASVACGIILFEINRQRNYEY